MITDQLRKAITKSGKSCYALGLTTGLRPEVISRFLRGERDLRMETAAKLAKALGLSFRRKGKSRKPKPTRFPVCQFAADKC
jgi:hypothetical protein